MPLVVRTDRGTENVHIASSQQMLREQHQNSLVNVAVMFGSSNHNQRIERFWSYLRHAFLDQYMDLFQGYIKSGVLDTSNALHNECLAFCFLGVIRKNLTQDLELPSCETN